MKLRKKIEKIRVSKGIGANEMGKLAGFCLSHIRQIERGTRKNISIQSLYKIAKVFDMTVQELIDDTEFDLREGKSDGRK